MAITDIFSKRQKRCEGNVPELLEYENLVAPLRVQLWHVLRRIINVITNSEWEKMHNDLATEYGLRSLGDLSKYHKHNGFIHFVDYGQCLLDFVLSTNDGKQVIDVVELSLRLLQDKKRKDPTYDLIRTQNRLPEIVNEINQRFYEHGVGYQFEGNDIVRVDSKLIHKEVVVPALGILGSPIFSGADDEFRSAHEHYRHGKYKECLTDCGNAFESTMKVICKRRSWFFEENAPAKKLIHVCNSNGLFATFMEEHLNGLVRCLESGVPVPRNKLSAHGQGTEIRKVPQHYASYCLHLTASNILFLAKCDEALK